MILIRALYEPYRKKTNIVDYAFSIDPDQHKHAAQANLDKHFSPPVDFLFQESLLYSLYLYPRETEIVADCAG